MNKLLALIRSEWKTAFDPKSIILNSMEDVKKNASAVYGISVGSAIEAQQKLMFRNPAMG